MKLESIRTHNDIQLYGYRFESEPTKLYWSMRLYQQTWHIPIRFFD
jgi:hypothetical protein